MIENPTYFKSFFNETATNYQKSVGTDFIGIQKINLLKKYASTQKLALEIGIANGLIATEIASSFKELKGIDYSVEMIEACILNKVEKNCTNISVLQMNANNLSFTSNSFDVVYSFSTLTYIQNIEPCINEISRVLKTNGIAIIDLVNKKNLTGQYWNRWHQKKGSWGQSLYTFKEVKTILEKSKLSIVELKAYGTFDQLMYLPVIGKFFEFIFKNIFARFWILLDTKISRKMPTFAGRWFVVCKQNYVVK